MLSLIKFYDFVQEINKENGRNYKLSILEKYKEDEDVCNYLHFVYNPYITTGISDKKLYKKLSGNYSSIEVNEVYKLLGLILKSNTGSDEMIYIIQQFKEKIVLPYEEQYEGITKLFDVIVTKNLILGISVLSINKSIPGLIPTFEVMLANSYFDKPEIVEGKEFALTTKIDGGRIIALKENGVVEFYTRAGQKYEGLVDLEEELRNMPVDNVCFDGEITLLDPKDLTSKDQYKQTMKITRKDGEKHDIKMLVFDCMHVLDFKNQTLTPSYKERRKFLDSIFNAFKWTYFTCLPVLYLGSDIDEINNYLNRAIQDGEEGVMINITDAPYEFKRTNNLLKVKKMKDIDLTIIGYEEGNNQNKGKLGAFIVDYKGHQVKVGSGFTKELREEVWKHPEDYVGLTASIQYFEETNNDKGGLSLRFPVFLDFRYDK